MHPFRSYVRVGPERYREHFGLDFEQFVPGLVFQHRPGLTLSQQDNVEESLDTINNAQLHYDAHYASKTEWQQCLGVSTMTLQKVIGMASKTFGRKAGIVGFDSVAMSAPVFGGDTLYAETRIRAVGESATSPELGLVNVTTRGINQNGDCVAEVDYGVQVYRAGRHPVEIAEGLSRDGVEAAKFASHRQIEPGVWREEIGIYFDDLVAGEIFEHRPGKTFSAEEIRLHALRSIELSPQHSNQHFVDCHGDGRLQVTEPYVVGAVTALTTRTFDRVVANLGWKNIQLKAPVYSGDTLYAMSRILDKRESKSRPDQGIMHVHSEAFNQNGQSVCAYERHFLIYKKGLGPYESAGY